MTIITGIYPSNGITVTNPRPNLSLDFWQPNSPNAALRLAVYLSKTNSIAEADPGALVVHVPPTYMSAIQYAEGNYNHVFSFLSSWPSLTQGTWYYYFFIDDSFASDDSERGS